MARQSSARPGRSRTLEIGQLHTRELTIVSDPDHRFGLGFSTDLWVYHLPLEHLGEAVMLQANRKPFQSWREVAAEAAKETDPRKLVKIIEKLCEDLEAIRLERSLGNPPPKRSKSTAA